jgi:hypothetical protein
MLKISIASAAVCLLASAHGAGSGCVSELWGTSGEAWSPGWRLSDFSLAGYSAGVEGIPDYPVLTSVRDHGAKGDGFTDDTEAFRRALSTVGERGAILVPAGRYVITDVLEINRSHVVLRGEGPEKSILVFPKPLSEIHPKENVDAVKSAYSFSGGFVVMKGVDTGKRIGEVVDVARRGDNHLILPSSGDLKAGDWIRLMMEDPPDHALLRHLHGDLLEPGADTPNLKRPVDWAARVTAVDGGHLLLDRPLRVDVRTEWRPVVHHLNPTLMGSGLENLGFEFPGVPKKPHLQEAGYNAVQIDGAVDCWVRKITVTDADNGIMVRASRFCTVEDFVSRSAKRTGLTGHHALWASGRTQDCVFLGFHCETPYVHDLTVEGCANGNVFTKGSGVRINCDHHRNAPYDNLFTDFDAGDPGRLFESSGRGDRGPHSGARTTFWCIRGNGAFPAIPPSSEWPFLNVVGFGNFSPIQDPQGPWIEPGDGRLNPVNLWEAQVKRRKERPGIPNTDAVRATDIPEKLRLDQKQTGVGEVGH